jgi:hypothetical protein
VDSPEVLGHVTPATDTTSLLMNPETPPDPYLISNLVAFLVKVDEEELL